MSAKNYPIDSTRLQTLYVQLDPIKDDPQHVLVQPGTYEDMVNWAATRNLLPEDWRFGDPMPPEASPFTVEIYDTIVPEIIDG